MIQSIYSPMLMLSLTYTTFGSEYDQPLHLTPYINQRDIETARNLSLVEDSDGVIPTSYAGFITVDQRLGNHLFFWFFPAINSDPQAPLVIWLNGGPGVPSMLGLFYKNGPLKLKSYDDNNTEYERRYNSWADRFSMLYIDNPVGVGFSYTEHEGYRTTQEEYAGDLFEFMNQFYVLFSEYLNRELYIGGQSYAGKYVPAFAYRIHQEIQANRSNIPLTGVYIGGPFFDPETQLPQFAEFYYSLCYISYKQRADIDRQLEEFLKSLNVNKTEYDIEYYFRSVSLIDFASDNILTYERAPLTSLFNVMNSDKFRTKTHVGNLISNNYPPYAQSFLNFDINVSTKGKLAELMNNFKVLIFTGDLDGLITSPMVEAGLMSTPWSMQSEYNNSVRNVWYDDDETMIGFYSKVGNFCRTTLHSAGHQVPRDQPVNTLLMMSQFIQYGCAQNN